MNRLFSIILIISGFTFTLFAQTDNCEELKKENEYLRNALKVNTPVIKASSQEIDFSITKIVGNKTEQTVTITVLLNNTAANRTFQWDGMGMKAIDLEGNAYSLKTSFTLETLYTDVPLKGEVVVQKILPKVALLKLLSLSYYPGNSSPRSPVLEFKDLSINWE